MPRRQHITVIVMIAVAAFLTFSFMWTFGGNGGRGQLADDKYTPLAQEPVLLDDGILKGEATATKLENATLKCVSVFTIHDAQANTIAERSWVTQHGKSYTLQWPNSPISQRRMIVKH